MLRVPGDPVLDKVGVSVHRPSTRYNRKEFRRFACRLYQVKESSR